MTPTWTRTQGDVGDTIVVRLGGVDNLDNVAGVSASVWSEDYEPVTLPAVVVSSSERTVQVNLGTWLENTAEPGVYELSLSVTDSGGGVRTWPEQGQGRITVRGPQD